jgi:hypothetical protein
MAPRPETPLLSTRPLHTALISATLLASGTAHAGSVDALGETLDTFNAQAHTPLPPLSPDQLEQLADGEVVTLLQRRADGRYLVVGMARTGVPKEQAWLATQDPHYGTEVATELALHVEPHASTWYHRIDLPRPFSDRHWVIDVWDNLELAEATGGEMWEHPWALRADGMAMVRDRVEKGEAPGLDLETIDAAVETPVNEGALDYIDLPGDDSVFVYAVATATGGGIPDRIVAAYSRARMHGNVARVVERARHVIPDHYRGDHAPVAGLDGRPLARFD